MWSVRFPEEKMVVDIDLEGLDGGRSRQRSDRFRHAVFEKMAGRTEGF